MSYVVSDADKFKAEFEKYQKEYGNKQSEGENRTEDIAKEKGDELADDLTKLKVEDSSEGNDKAVAAVEEQPTNAEEGGEGEGEQRPSKEDTETAEQSSKT